MTTYQDYINALQENSMVNWWPKVKDLDIPMPKTVMVDCAEYHDQFWSMLDGNADIPLAEEIDKIIREEFSYPCFLRGDYTSGKHAYFQTCYLSDMSDKDNPYYNLHRIKYLKFHIFNLVEQAVIGPEIMPDALFIREFLQLEHSFKAFHSLPIAKERRYFINSDDNEVKCFHPYWPVDTIRFYDDIKPPEDWQMLLANLNLQGNDENILYKYCAKLMTVLPGYWSVDFAKTIDGTWYFIDAAKGEHSFHWPDCIISAKLM